MPKDKKKKKKNFLSEEEERLNGGNARNQRDETPAPTLPGNLRAGRGGDGVRERAVVAR